MIDVPAQWQSILAIGFAVETAIEVVRHWHPSRAAVLIGALVTVLYFGADPVALLGWKFNAAAWGADYVKAAFNALLLAGITMRGHDVIKRFTGG